MRSLAAFVCLTLLYLNTNVHSTKSVKIKLLRTDGYFTIFLRNFFDTLMSFPTNTTTSDSENFHGLSPFMYVLSKLVGEMGYHKTKRLARVLKKLSRQNELDIKDVLSKCKKDLDDKVSWRIKFLKAMNAIFTPEQNLLFNDYIRELKRYANNEKKELTIVDETRVILNYVILNRVLQIGPADRRDLREKMKKAIKEYKVWSASSILLHLDEPGETSDEDGGTSDDDSYETLNNKIHMKLSKNASAKIIISVLK